MSTPKSQVQESASWASAVLLFLVALALFLVRLSLWSPYPDELGYAETAQQLIEQGTPFSDSDMFFPPLFVYLATALQWLGVELLLSVRLVAAAFGAGIVAVCYVLVTESYGRRAGWIGALALLVLTQFNEYSRRGQPETLHFFFGLLAFLWALRWAREPRARRMLISGVWLGLAVWGKEVSLSYLLGLGAFLGACWVVLGRRTRLADLGGLAGGLALLLVPLLIFGELSGNSLLFEVTGEKPYDVNMLSLPLVENLKHTARSTLLMFGTHRGPAYVLGIPAVLAIATLLVLGAWRRRPLAILALGYGVILLVFVTWFRQKFSYYILPAVLLAHVCAVAELVRHFGAVPRPRLRPLYLAGATFLAANLALNLVADRNLYLTRGPYESFRNVLREADLGSGSIVASHSPMFLYHNRREELGLDIQPLLSGPDYQLNWTALRDERTSAVITKDYYLDTLSEREDWAEMRTLYPHETRMDGLVILLRRPSD